MELWIFVGAVVVNVVVVTELAANCDVWWLPMSCKCIAVAVVAVVAVVTD